MSTEISRQNLQQAMDQLVHDPSGFSDFMARWNEHFSETYDDPKVINGPIDGPQRDDDLEGAAHAALISIARQDDSKALALDVGQMLNRFPHGAFMATKDGLITASNDTAFARFDIDHGQHVNQLNYSLFAGRSLEQAIADVCSANHARSDVVIERAVENNTERSTTVAIIQSRKGSDTSEASELVFIIDPVWREDVAQLLQRAFDLSDAESEIVSGFMQGYSTREIAAQRNRSYATVRTQFQTILNKAGATTQVELMRTALSLSQFIADVEPLASAAAHPTRRRADVLRPNNRSVDTLFYGDPDGEPVIYLHNMYTRTFPPVIEAELAKAGLYFIAPARPGYGQSTQPSANQDYIDCYVNDIRAVLDQMQIERCKILGHVTAAPFTFAACAEMPERFSHAFVTSSSTPAPFIKLTSVGSNWTSALVSACKVSPRMGGLILSSGLRWTRKHGVTRFLAKHHRNSPADLEISLRQDVLKDFSESYEFSCAQGFESGALGFVISSDDWSNLVEQSPIPTTLIHGCQDSHFSVEAAREFRDAYSDKINLIEFEDAGQLVMMTHIQEVIQVLQSDLKP